MFLNEFNQYLIEHEYTASKNVEHLTEYFKEQMPGFFNKLGETKIRESIIDTLDNILQDQWKEVYIFDSSKLSPGERYDEGYVAQAERIKTVVLDKVLALLYDDFLKPKNVYPDIHGNIEENILSEIKYNELNDKNEGLKLLVLSNIMLDDNISTNIDWDDLNEAVDFLINGGFRNPDIIIDKVITLLQKDISESKDDVGSTRKPDRYAELGIASPDSGRSSAEIAQQLRHDSLVRKEKQWTGKAVAGRNKAEQARIEKYKDVSTFQLKKLANEYDYDLYMHDSSEHKDIKREIKRRERILRQEREEAKLAGFTRTVRGKVIGDEKAHKRAIKAEARAKREEEKAKKQAERKVKQDAFKKASSGVIDRRSNKPAPDPSKPWNIMKLKGGRKEYRKILNSPSHPRHNEAKEISVKSESMQYDFETFISEWSLNPMDWFDDNDDEKDDLDKIPGDDSGMIKKNVGKVRSRNRKTKRAGDCIIQGKEYDPNTGGCR